MTASRELALKVLRHSEWLQGEPPALIEALLTHGRLLHLNSGELGTDRGG